MNITEISNHEVLGGGVIKLWMIEGCYCVTSIVRGVVKHSEAVSKSKADYFIMDAVDYGCLDF